jgi:hypothetical protein
MVQKWAPRIIMARESERFTQSSHLIGVPSDLAFDEARVVDLDELVTFVVAADLQQHQRHAIQGYY